MTNGNLIPRGEVFTIETEYAKMSVCMGEATYQGPIGPMRMEGVAIQIDHHITGNHHSLIFSTEAAKKLVQLINAAITQ